MVVFGQSLEVELSSRRVKHFALDVELERHSATQSVGLQSMKSSGREIQSDDVEARLWSPLTNLEAFERVSSRLDQTGFVKLYLRANSSGMYHIFGLG